MLPEKSFDTGEVVLNYAEGPPSGPPLLLLHGGTQRWQVWEYLLPQLTPHWQVYALDLRGHGNSGQVAYQYRVVDYTRDVVAFIQQLSEPAVVMGHSLGAAITLTTAAACPERTWVAVALDPPLYLHSLGVEASADFKEFLTWFLDTVQQSTSHDMIVARCREWEPESDELRIATYADQISRVAPDTVQIILEDQLFAGLDLAATLRQIQRPLLLLYGDWAQGAAMREEDAAFVRAHLPSAVVTKIPNGSHMFIKDQTELTMRHINAFLSSRRADAKANV